MDFKQQIDAIIAQRKIQADKISRELETICTLRGNLRDISNKIADLNLDNGNDLISSLNEYSDKLETAEKQAQLLEKRFSKETINIGVSGFTHAGKSTLLQTISGLSDEEMPTANEKGDNFLHPTTAICSQIVNDKNKFAIIKFKDKEGFNSYVNAHIDIINKDGNFGIKHITNYTDVERLNLPEKKNGDAEFNTIIDRLEEIKESPYKSILIHGDREKRIEADEFNEITNYVSYQTNDKNKRFFPVVDEVIIHCPFPSLKGENTDTKLCLVDLPGFGEFETVDKVQIGGLKEKVDHIAFIYKTNKDEGIDRDKYAKCQNIILSINKDLVEYKSDFESFIVNQDKSIDIWQKLTDETRNTIENSYGKGFNVYAFSARNEPESSQSALNDILQKLSASLVRMDNEIYNAYEKNKVFAEIYKGLQDFLSKLGTIIVVDTPTDLVVKADKLRVALNQDLKKLLCSYIDPSNVVDVNFAKMVDTIREKIDEDIEKTMLYDKNEDFQTWEEYIEKSILGGIGGNLNLELKRLWLAIINRYLDLDATYEKSLNTLKNEIADIFLRHTGNLFCNESVSIEVIQSKLQKLSNDNQLRLAVEQLSKPHQDFRQSLYPYIFKEEVNYILQPKNEKLEDGTEKGRFEIEKKAEALDTSTLRPQLVSQTKKANYEIRSTILENYVLKNFLIGVLDTFRNMLFYTNAKNNNRDFVSFCSEFKSDLYPDEYGTDSNADKIQSLKDAINETIKLIEK